MRFILYFCALFSLVFLTNFSIVLADQFGTFEGKPTLLLDRQEIETQCKSFAKTPGQHDRILLTSFRYKDPKGLTWSVPSGACVNGASIPKAFWSFIGGPLSGKYVEASIIHDYYCTVKSRPWQETHEAFYYAMRARGVSATKAATMYQAVQKFGPRWEKVKVKGKSRIVTGRSFLYYSVIDELSKLANTNELSELGLSEFLNRSEEQANKTRPSTHSQLPSNCSALVPELSTGDFSGSLIVCDNSEEKTKLIALQNIRNLQKSLVGVRASNSRFLSVFHDYISQPTEENWQKVIVRTKTTRLVVSQAMRAWFKVNDMEPADPEHFMARISHLLSSRAAMLGDLLITGQAPSEDDAYAIFDRYTKIAEQLRRVLKKLEVQLEEKISAS